jgi:hypothetical protein
MEREARLQGILHISRKLHLSGYPVKVPSLKVPFMESLGERCPTTRALLHSSTKVPGIRAPSPPTYQVPLGNIVYVLKLFVSYGVSGLLKLLINVIVMSTHTGQITMLKLLLSLLLNLAQRILSEFQIF